MSSFKLNRVVIRVSIIAALAGLLFGLDVAYVNGALNFIAKEFNLTIAEEGDVAAYLLVGAAVGALISGWLSRKFGRKKVLILAASIFTLATIYAVSVHEFNLFLAARFVIGLGVGIASFVAPLYLSEIAPSKIRGSLIAMYQLMITIGIFLMFISNTILEQTGSWRMMLIVLVIPSLTMLIGTFTLPESPRWKALVGDMDGVYKILKKIRNNEEEVKFEYSEILETIKQKTGSANLLGKKYFLKVAILGVCLQFLQQFSGINAFMYYSSKIFAEAGFTNPNIGTIVVGLVNVLTTILSIKFIDKLGRKPILYLGLTILVISCGIVGYLFSHEAAGMPLDNIQQYILVIFCLLFIFGFAVSLGPIIWIICAEIFPLEGRDLGVTITTMANWIFNTIIGKYTLLWFTTFGVGQTFWMFGVTCCIGFIIIKFFTPETKNVPLEKLEMNLKAGRALKDIGKHHII